MTSISISDDEIPELVGKVAIITGGASGIGLATARLLSSRGAKVHLLDVNPPLDKDLPASINYIPCDVTNWNQQRAAFEQAGPQIDLAVACAGTGEGGIDYFADSFDPAGRLEDPPMPIIEVNYGGVLKFIKLAVSYMRRSGQGGSVVIFSSSTAYSPEIDLPLYSSLKAAVLSLVRCLAPTMIKDNITVNAIAPAATETPILPEGMATYLREQGALVSPPEMVARAVVWSAIAGQEEGVPWPANVPKDEGGRWNGRCLITSGDGFYTEVEEPLARLRKAWLGEEEGRLAEMQVATKRYKKEVLQL